MAEATQVANDQLIENEQVQNRIEKMHKLEERGILPFGHRFDWTHHNTDVHEHAKEMEEAGTEVKVAGRVMAIRGHGKTCFMDLHDKTGRIQLYLRKDVLGEDAYSVTRLMDIGDIIGVTGTVFLTHTGEPSIRVTDLQFLSKALKPLPEKFHGLKDMDLRYRQRYVDLIMNPEVKDVFVKRTQIIKSIRRILDEDGFLEVETPVLNTISGGATARPFITYHNALNIQLYLRIATELNLKRLIVGGMERVYELGRVFRNEGMDIKHNPEFTTLELYQAYGDMDTMMDITEKLVSQTAQNVLGTMKITYEGQEIDLTPPWPAGTTSMASRTWNRPGPWRRKPRWNVRNRGAWARSSMPSSTRSWKKSWFSPCSSANIRKRFPHWPRAASTIRRLRTVSKASSTAANCATALRN